MPKMHGGRRYTLVFEDPLIYHQQLNEVGEYQVLFELSTVQKRKVDVYSFMRQYFHGKPWQAYISSNWSTTLIDHTSRNIRDIKGCWPSWNYKYYNLKELKDYIENPWSGYMPNETASWSDKPKADQPHIIFVKDIRFGSNGDQIAKNRRLRLKRIQQLYPEVELFLVPAAYNYNLQFGMGFTASSMCPPHIQKAGGGAIYLPNGRHIMWKDIPDYKAEISILGYEADWVQADRNNAVLYMIESARYAAHHWDDPTGPYPKPRNYETDYHNPTMYAMVPSYQNAAAFNPEKIKETDKVLCNACSLWRKCPSYRSGEVCNLTGTESGRLARLAKTRDASGIVDMLGSIVEMQAERIDKRMQREADPANEGAMDADVDKMLDKLFKNSTVLAKLKDPSLGRPLVQINMAPEQQAARQIAQADPRAIGASIIAEIEASGVKREDITPDMVEAHIAKKMAQRQLTAIDGEVVDDG